MLLSFIKCHGSGNDFPLIDARDLALAPAEWSAIARTLADRAGAVGGDGLLLLTAGDDRHAFGMAMFNPDGSEAETCLNGLRCTARLGFELTGLAEARVRLKASSAEAARDVPLAPGVTTIRTVAVASTDLALVGLGIAGPALVEARIPTLPSERRFTGVAMPNPHLVSFVDQVDEAELVALGDWIEAGPAVMPGRGNVSFVERRGPESLFVRTYERGVGLTDSCGSAMAASTFAAGLTGRISWDAEVTVFNRGGLVRARALAPEAGAQVSVSGNATFLYRATAEIDRATGSIAGVTVEQDFAHEAEAWRAAVAASAG